MAFGTSGPLSHWVCVKEESREGDGCMPTPPNIATRLTMLKNVNGKNQAAFQEMAKDVNSVELSPCYRNQQRNNRTVSVDTLDLDSYYSAPRKKDFVSSKTIAVDTSDLESHYEFYRYERIKIGKTVSTDTHDLECRRISRCTSNVGVGTDDLFDHIGQVPRHYFFNLLNRNISVVRGEPLECKLGLNAGEHFVEPSWSNGMYITSDLETSSGKVTQHDYPRDCVQGEGNVSAKSDLELVPKSDVEQTTEYFQNDVNKDTPPFSCPSDNKKISKNTPLVSKKDLKADSNTHKIRTTVISELNNEEITNDSDASYSIDGDLDDPSSNISSAECIGNKSENLKEEDSVGKDEETAIDSKTSSKLLEDDISLQSEDECKFECDICKAKFLRKHSMMIHLRVHGNFKPFSCKDCGKKLTTFNQARIHGRIHPMENLSEVRDGEIGSGLAQKKRKAAIGPMAKVFRCNRCRRSFRFEKQLKRHQCCRSEAKQMETCSTCNKTFRSAAALYNHVRIHNKIEEMQLAFKQKMTAFECLTCGKVFRCRSALKCHETVHTGERNFVCETCNKPFPTKASLKAHSSTHTGLKPYVCTSCGKAFAKNDSLKTHIRKHTGERPFKCDVCGQAFDRNFTLKNHRVTHTGEKTHICPMCGKAFSTRGALSTHERTRHNTNPEKPRKPYKRRTRDFEPCICDVCGKVYSNQANLRIHKVTHTGDKPFLCTVCGQSFAKKYTLQCHTRKHTDERPFSCDICGLTFFRNHTLKTHKLRHTGERPHICSLCGKSFIQSASLSYHIRNHDRPPKIFLKARKRKKKMMTPEHQMIPEVILGTHTGFSASPPYQHPLAGNKIHSNSSMSQGFPGN